MLVSVGGSISTGSTPWIDIISSYDKVNVLAGELRIGESGLYEILYKLYLNIPPSIEEYQCVEKLLLEYAQNVTIVTHAALSILIRIPGLPNSIRRNISSYRLRKRGYNKLLPGFSLYSKEMLKKVLFLIENYDAFDNNTRRLRLVSLMEEYLCYFEKTIVNDDKDIAVIDQLVPPRLLFDERYGPIILNIMSALKIIVVRRDPRDQFIDMLRKKKKRYHIMSRGDAVSTYVDQYLPRYDRMEAMLKGCDSSRVLDIWFEDIFFDYESTLNKLESFIGLKTNGPLFTSIDFSAASRKIKMYNTGEFSQEVAFIEGSMKRHLYPY
ncbi:MAG: sulfotransferase [Pseudomonadota bacterium]